MLRAVRANDLEWRRLVPNLATGLTLLLGLGAIEASRFGDPDLALRFILLAVLSDGIDGVLARRWGVASNFGAQLDSLADLVAFGVAPGILFAAQHPEAPGPVRVFIIASIAIAGAWRLARFQSEPSRPDFVGLPITVGGPLFALAVTGVLKTDLAGALMWGLALSALMASRVPYPRFTSGRLGRVSWGMAVAFLLALATNAGFAVLAAQLSLMAYVGWGMFRSLGLAAVGGRPATGGRGRGD
jgi:CDP-diacylglycerol--serine O-phosphatidyltransferase